MSAPIELGVPATSLLDTLAECAPSHVVTVPDWVQMSALKLLYDGYLNQVRVVDCCAEDQAVAIAAGLYAGGMRPVVMIQNQGFYAGLNAIRDVGLGAHIPLCMLIGQFGREFDLERDPRESDRIAVRMIEPILDVMGIPYWRLESADDLPALVTCFDEAYRRSTATALLIGRNTAWS